MSHHTTGHANFQSPFLLSQKTEKDISSVRKKSLFYDFYPMEVSLKNTGKVENVSDLQKLNNFNTSKSAPYARTFFRQKKNNTGE